jgi:hypothetical protein
MSFPGETVDALRWNEAGTSLAIATEEADADGGIIRTISYPDLEVREIARRPGILSLSGVTNGNEGPAWLEMSAGAASIWGDSPNGPRPLQSLPRPIVNLQDTTKGFLGLDAAPGDVPVVASVEGNTGTGALEPIVTSTMTIVSFDVSSDGRRLVTDEGNPGESVAFIVRTAGQADLVLRPPGYLIGEPILGPDPNTIFYEDHDDQTLKRINTRSSKVDTVVVGDVSGSQISAQGVIAHTFVDPSSTNQICFEDMPESS